MSVAAGYETNRQRLVGRVVVSCDAREVVLQREDELANTHIDTYTTSSLSARLATALC